MRVRSPGRKILIAAAVVLLTPGAALRAADPEPASTVPATAVPAATVPTPSKTTSAPSAAAPAPATAPAERAAVKLPEFRFGLWEYQRTVVRAGSAKPQVSSVKRCVDPGTDMREKMETLKKTGCQFAPLRRSGERYISSWVCQTPVGAMRFRDVLLVTDPNSYEDLSETHTAQHVTQQKIEGKRVGECPGMGSGAPPTPAKKSPPRRP